MDKAKVAQLLAESAALLDNDIFSEDESLNEDVGAIAAAVGMIAAYLGVFVALPILANRAQLKKIAREAKQITREEIHEAVKFLNTLKPKIEALFKQSKYKKYIEEGIINIKGSDFIDASEDKNIKNKPFQMAYNMFSISLVALAKKQNKFDEVTTSSDRLADYIKAETKELAKLCDKIREIVNVNKFIKDNFQLSLYFNDNKSICWCTLVPRYNFVLNTSKWVKNSKDKSEK